MSLASIELSSVRRHSLSRQLFEETRKMHGRILVADDSSDGRRMIAGILHSLGFDVTTAENGRVACDIALSAWKRGEGFDLVLMDWQMPIIDGYEATALLRSVGYDGRIVALTSPSTFYRTHDKCEDAGFDGWASKPITFEMLRDVTRRYVPHLMRQGRSACA